MKKFTVKVDCFPKPLAYEFTSRADAEDFANNLVNVETIEYLPAMNQFVVTLNVYLLF